MSGIPTFEPDIACVDCSNAVGPLGEDLYLGCRGTETDYDDPVMGTYRGMPLRCRDVRGTDQCRPSPSLGHRIGQWLGV